MSDSEETDVTTSVLTGFLFGNIDQEGRLENDFLDQDICSRISTLANLGVGSYVEELKEAGVEAETDKTRDSLEKEADAVDYFNIETEDIDLEASTNSFAVPSNNNNYYPNNNNNNYYPNNNNGMATKSSFLLKTSEPKSVTFKDVDDDYEADEEQQPQQQPQQQRKSDGEDKDLLKKEGVAEATTTTLPNISITTTTATATTTTTTTSTTSQETTPSTPQVTTKMKKRKRRRHKKVMQLDTPLGCMLPSHLAHIDVTKYFPEFRRNKVLRFLKLFKPAHSCSMWKKKKPKSFNQLNNNDITHNINKANNNKHGKGDVTKSFKKARMAFAHELATDDLETFKEEGDGRQSGRVLEGGGEVESAEWQEWRHGAAKLWYDRMKLSSKQHCAAEYALKIKQGVQNNKGDFDIEGEDIWKLQEAVSSIEDHSESLPCDITDLLDGNVSVEVPCQEGGGKEEVKKEEEKEVKEDLKEVIGKEMEKEGVVKEMIGKEGMVDMVVQQRWEDSIIWSGEEVREKVLKELPLKLAKVGWLPHNNTRTFQTSLQHHNQQRLLDTTQNFYPTDSSLLSSGDWLKNIIWDNKYMDAFLTPQTFELNNFHDDFTLRLPDTDEISNVEDEQKTQVNKKVDLKRKGSCKSLPVKEDVTCKKEEEVEMVGLMLADDDYYDPELSTESALGKNVCSTILQHSTPAVELRAVLFPCHLSITKLRNFHRPHLKKYSHGAMTSAGPHPVLPLIKQIRRKQKLREQERQASGGGEVFFMRSLEDLSCRDGDMLLFEYSEQHPPLLNQVGMATKIKNYFKRRPGQESSPPDLEYGDLAYTHTPPFLGTIKPGQCLRSLENSMFRGPIYQHKQAPTDFFIIRNRNHYFIRDCNALFVVGQLCPLTEVPSPNSKRANNFVRESLQLSISRLFSMNKDEPRKIRMEDVRRQFPSHSESSIRKKLKLYADFRRTGMDSGWWVWKSSVRFPSEEEMRRLLVPEQCCAYYSMLSAQQRLKDAGYGEKVLFTIEDDDEEEVNNKLEDEVKAAPWNTTNAFISSMKGKCLLALGGFADPTSCGEGFAYVKVPNKPQQNKFDSSTGQLGSRRMVTGTDADLRRLPLKDAKDLLRKLGLDDATVKRMGRWEVIDMVRKVSTEKAKYAEDGSWVSKFARGNKLSQLEHLERYKHECQRIFDLQNRVLGSEEVLSTDEGESSGDEEDMENMGKSIENMFSSRKSSLQVQQEREEKERQELTRMLKTRKKQEPATGSRKLQITRTFRGEDGRTYTRLEVVKKPALIDMYIKIREHKDPTFINQFTMVDNQMKEEMKKEKKRIQEKLRKLKRQEQDEDDGGVDNDGDFSRKKPRMEKMNKNQKLTCGACGKTGHMRTNKECPMFNKSDVKRAELKEEEEELVNVEGTKVTLSKLIVKQAESLKKSMLVLKLPGKKEERRRKSSSQEDYLVKPKKVLKRCRADPVVSLISLLENILNEMRELPISTQFLQPVNSKKVPDYYNIIKNPMDLQTLRENLRDRKYTCREVFLKDVYLIVSNCRLYNGEAHPLSASAQKMFDHCLQRIAEKEDKLMKLEKLIDPLLDDDDMVSLAFIITSIIEDRLKVVDGSVQFHTPVNRKQYKDYYDVIQAPIDLKTMHKKAQERKYHNRKEFLKDMELLVKNCSLYNGPHSSLTNTANVMLNKCKQALDEQEETLDALEENIRQAQEEVLYDDNDSLLTSLTGEADTELQGSRVFPDDNKDNDEVLVDVEGDSKVPLEQTHPDDDVEEEEEEEEEEEKEEEEEEEDKLTADDDNTKISGDDVEEEADRSGEEEEDDEEGEGKGKKGEDDGGKDFDPQDFFNSLLHQNESTPNDTKDDKDDDDGRHDNAKVTCDDDDYESLSAAGVNTLREEGATPGGFGEEEEEEEEEDLSKIEEPANLEDDLQLSDSDQSDEEGRC